jgi:hypothetical protein
MRQRKFIELGSAKPKRNLPHCVISETLISEKPYIVIVTSLYLGSHKKS